MDISEKLRTDIEAMKRAGKTEAEIIRYVDSFIRLWEIYTKVTF